MTLFKTSIHPPYAACAARKLYFAVETKRIAHATCPELIGLRQEHEREVLRILALCSKVAGDAALSTRNLLTNVIDLVCACME
jgi:hypothetical protein